MIDPSSMPRPSVEVVPFEALHQPLSPLFLDYLAGRPGVAPFLGEGGFGLDALREAANISAAHPRPREAVVPALVRQQEKRGAEHAATRARELAHPEAVAVVTGQQAGLFGGPLFVLHKALATLEIARRLSEERGVPAVPVFWVAADDHDFAEVRSVCLLDGSGAIRLLRYEPRHEPVGQPAHTIVLDDTITRLANELSEALPPSSSREEMVGIVAECYRAGETLSGAFARLLSRLIPDLVVLDSSDPALKTVTSPVLRREVEEASPTSRLALEAGRALLDAGYHQQVPVRKGFLNLFVLAGGERRALGLTEDGVEIRGLGTRLATAEALRQIETEPELWSPNALLRPLTQDAMLPTAAYVGGPAEIAYHAQIHSSYAHFGLPRPGLVPRPSVTVVGPSAARALEAEGLTLSDLTGDPEAVVARWARQTYPEVEAAFAQTRSSIERDMGEVEERLAAVDPTLRAATAATRGRALHQVERLHEKAMRALKKRDEGRAARLRRTRDALVPGGSLQERGLGLLGLVARHGPGVIAELQERVDPFSRGHQVVRL
jgi:bacillithiol biosynthesis cysteine-adding enzyme BshC